MDSPGTIVFVNWTSFAIHHEDDPISRDFFWPQLETLQPESYFADCRNTSTVVSKNASALDLLERRLRQQDA